MIIVKLKIFGKRIDYFLTFAKNKINKVCPFKSILLYGLRIYSSRRV